MTGVWVACPPTWNLVDVQAALNVIVTALSFFGSYVLIQNCWQLSAGKAARGIDVPLHSLLRINTLGEVWDVVILLRRKIFISRYAKACAQCFIVILFSTTAILSGPIVRYSSKTMHVSRMQNVIGLLASDDITGNMFQSVAWNHTYTILEEAGFPLNQLVDFLPDKEENWVYNMKEWNNSWTMDCQYTGEATVTLEATSNCSDIRSELLGLEAVIPSPQYPTAHVSFQGGDSRNVSSDILMVYAADHAQLNSSGHYLYAMALVFLHWSALSGAQTNTSGLNQTGCYLGAGPTGSASYSKVACNLVRDPKAQWTNYHAHPVLTNDSISLMTNAFSDRYFGRFEQEWYTAAPVTIVPPEELLRFYQAYMAVKDTMMRIPVTRPLSVNTPIVHLSAIFLVFASIVSTINLIGAASIGSFLYRHRNVAGHPPQTRIDWMLQSVEAADRPLHPPRTGPRKSVTVDSLPNLQNLSKSQRRRAEFETAMYSARETTTWFLRRSPNAASSTSSIEMHQHGTSPDSRSSRHWFTGRDSAGSKQGLLVTETELF